MKLKYDEPLSNVAFKFNLRRCNKAFVDPERQYYISFEVNHPGAENWPYIVQEALYDNAKSATLTMTEFMDGLVLMQTATIVRIVGKGLHSSTFRLDVSTLCRYIVWSHTLSVTKNGSG